MLAAWLSSSLASSHLCFSCSAQSNELEDDVLRCFDLRAPPHGGWWAASVRDLPDGLQRRGGRLLRSRRSDIWDCHGRRGHAGGDHRMQRCAWGLHVGLHRRRLHAYALVAFEDSELWSVSVFAAFSSTYTYIYMCVYINKKHVNT